MSGRWMKLTAQMMGRQVRGDAGKSRWWIRLAEQLVGRWRIRLTEQLEGRWWIRMTEQLVGAWC